MYPNPALTSQKIDLCIERTVSRFSTKSWPYTRTLVLKHPERKKDHQRQVQKEKKDTKESRKDVPRPEGKASLSMRENRLQV
jgi:hypothetical protein